MELLSLKKFNGKLICKCKGQITSTEFLIVSVVLIILFVFATNFWNIVAFRFSEKTLRSSLELAALDISDMLIKTPGLPGSWQDDTAKIFSLGLAKESHVLDAKKVRNFVNMSYDRTKNLFGIPQYEFYFQLKETNGSLIKMYGIAEEPIAYIATQDPDDVGIRDMLNRSSLIWDFYWKGNSAPATTARYTYLDDDKVSLYKKMISNLSSYKTVISEDSHVKDTDLSSSEQQSLRNFVNAGNTYFHVQHEEELLKIFGLTPTDPNSDKGTVVALDDVLHDVPIGTNIIFQQGTKTFDIPTSPLPLKTLMTVTTDSTNCIFCKWTYGSGKIYYIPDANSTTPFGYVPGLDIVGERMEVGKKPLTAANVVNSRRVVLFGNEIVYMDFMIWR